MKLKKAGVIFLSVLAFGCAENKVENNSEANSQEIENTVMNRKDIHSFAKPEEAVVVHLDWTAKVDFQNKTISGKAGYRIKNISGTDEILFDNKDLKIEKVTLGENEEKVTEFEVGEHVEYLGNPVRVKISPDTKYLTIYYSTSPDAGALQWLSPEQTAGKKEPFLFTQSQAILARSWIPCQDSPGIRMTYSADVEVPKGLLALMSAANPTGKSEDGKYRFEMKQPVPSYLLALAVGDLQYKAVGKQTGVYAEPSVVEAAAYEFGEMQNMLEAAEELYGPYRWEQYDVIVLPPSFPFGGMENPRLTFATPTVIAGDRSLTSLIAHELAHSWSGNLVTNATWNDFWLNEGFTVYFEKRIMEKLYGKSYAEMLNMLGHQDLIHTVEKLKKKDQYNDTRLKLELSDREPDDGMTDIAYEKGYFFLRTIEEAVGRERWDGFLRKYFDEFAFKTMTTEEFVTYLEKELIQGDKQLTEKLAINTWIYETGVPENCPTVKSDRFAKVEEAIGSWQNGAPVASLNTSEWTTHEWLHFLRHLPESMTNEQMSELDQQFNFTASGNSEVLHAWFVHVINNDYKTAYPELENFLVNVGRRKFLTPLYKAMTETEDGKKRALKVYKKARPNYHYVSVSTIDDLLEWKRTQG